MDATTRILLFNAINVRSEVETRYPHLGFGYLAAALRGEFGASALSFRLADSALSSHLAAFHPDFVFISAVSQNYNLARHAAADAKRTGARVLIGGMHITALPHTMTRDMDVAVLGEGEVTVREIMAHYLNRRGDTDLAAIPGIAFRRTDGHLVVTPPRPLISDLDTIPLPARDIMKIGTHTYLFTSRGCPYNCIFCASSRFWKKVRYFSAEYVIREISILAREHGARFISFFDDLFVADRERLREIVRLARREPWYGSLKFSCSSRANHIDAEIASLLKQLGVVSVGFGLESGNERVLHYLKGPNLSPRHGVEALEHLRHCDICANASFVIGAPDETEREMLDTYAYIKNLPLALFDVYVLTPLPGTPLWRQALDRGLVREDDAMDWGVLNVNFDQNMRRAVILSKQVDRDRLIAVYRRFQSLRMRHNIAHIWNSPFLMDVPRYIARKLREKMRL